MDLTFTSRTHEGWTILSVAGELDLQTSPQLTAAINDALEGGPPLLALDLAAVPFMDSSSLGVVVASLKRVREKGGDLALLAMQSAPRKIMTLTGLDAVLQVLEADDQLPHS